MKKESLTKNPRETQTAGECLVKEIIKNPPLREAFVIGLEGDLGGGKTTFLQGVARGLGIREKVNSPTFVIIKKYRIKKKVGRKNKLKFENFYHIDCYRIKRSKEILGLGLEKIISNPKNIVAIEWADLIKKVLPKNSLWITFKFVDKNKRGIMVR